MHDNQGNASCMCTSGDQLMVTRCGDGVFCYSLSGELKWRRSGKLSGSEMSASAVTTDREGHVFVCDNVNRCIHVISEQNGAFLGVLEGIGQREPSTITWHADTASLVVAANFSLSVFSRQ